MNSNFSTDNSPNEEVDLLDILKLFKRRWRIILIFILSSIFFSVPYSLTRQKIWKGKFQIVIENKTKSNSRSGGGDASSKLFGALLGSSLNLDSDLSTQVLILESPSILKPVYNVAKNLYIEKGKDVSNLTYEKWFESYLKINLLKKSSVLEIAYKDSHKENIIPILNSISLSYQNYSKKDRENSLSSGIVYVEKQLNEFKEKSRIANRKLDFYKMKYGISTSSGSSSGYNNSYLKNITELSQIYSIGGLTKGDDLQSFDSPLSKLSGLNQELFKRRQYFKESDESIQNLLRQRDQLIKYIESTANGLIALPNKDNLSKNEAQEIIIEYKELKREADRNLGIVNDLENNLISLKMEKAKEEVPWELISTPTVLDSPVAPKKKIIVGLYLLFGTFLGISFAVINDIKSDKVYKFEKLIEMLPFPLIHNVIKKEELIIKNHLNILLKGFLKNYDSIAFFCLGDFTDNFSESYKSSIKKILKGKNILITKNINEIENFSAQILITEVGKVTKTEIKIAKEQLTLQDNNLIGMIVINS